MLLRISEGDEQAFMILYRHYYAQLKPYVRKYAVPSMDAEEILQLTFLKVWMNRDKLPEVENLRAWIFRIAYREYLTAIRQRLTYEGRNDRYTAGHSNNQPSPHEAVYLQGIAKCVQETVSKLSPQRKTIYELSRGHGLKNAEIAEKLNISPNTVKNSLQAALGIIRANLLAEGYGPLALMIFIKIIENR